MDEIDTKNKIAEEAYQQLLIKVLKHAVFDNFLVDGKHVTLESYTQMVSDDYLSGESVEYLIDSYTKSHILKLPKGLKDIYSVKLEVSVERVPILLMYMAGRLYNKGLINEAQFLLGVVSEITALNQTLKFLAKEYKK